MRPFLRAVFVQIDYNRSKVTEARPGATLYLFALPFTLGAGAPLKSVPLVDNGQQTGEEQWQTTDTVTCNRPFRISGRSECLANPILWAKLNSRSFCCVSLSDL